MDMKRIGQLRSLIKEYGNMPQEPTAQEYEERRQHICFYCEYATWVTDTKVKCAKVSCAKEQESKH